MTKIPSRRLKCFSSFIATSLFFLTVSYNNRNDARAINA